MTCDADTLEALTQIDGLAKLSDRDILICLAGVYGMNADSDLSLAKRLGLEKLSDNDLEQVFLAAICV